jgi:hypothetical protein
MARLDKLGAFALTEAAHGSDALALETAATRDGDEYVLTGEKRWIGNGSIADVIVLWARDTSDGHVKGFLVEKNAPGYDARVIEGKGSVRAVLQAEICPRRRPGTGRKRAPRRAQLQRRRSGARLDPDRGRLGLRSATPWRPRRGGAELRQAAHPVRQALGELPIGPGTAGQDACRGHHDAAVLPACQSPRGAGKTHRHDRRTGRDEQHAQGPPGDRRPATC